MELKWFSAQVAPNVSIVHYQLNQDLMGMMITRLT